MNQIGPFEIIHPLGKGGMGEVFLAKDPSCGRLVALKKIREDLLAHKGMQERFLREAKIAAQLTHPSIIPIYAISEDSASSYYTMPYIEGETLKEILRSSREREKKGEASHPIGGSIPTLIRIFWNICQAIAYVHARGILHRDLKPDNIIIGKFGEVMLLDWGLACHFGEEENFPNFSSTSTELTHPGKVPGTLTYVAPERALGEKASPLTDIYALGVMLFQLLTLRLPFHRTSLAEFRKEMQHEEIGDPFELAPYRDIPLQLAVIAKKCLAPKKEERYQSVAALIEELQNYIEGRPEWILTKELTLTNKANWEFQENILLTKHLAITRAPEVMEWVNLMISKGSFAGNIRIETRVCLGAQGTGIGLLFCIPEELERMGFADGYTLWIGSESERSSKLFRAGVEVMQLPDVALEVQKWHTLVIEKIDNHVRFFLDGNLQMHYLSYRPIVGTHVGMLLRDADFQMEPLKISVGSLSVQVNCLAVPDAFFANHLYGKALSEYRRIGYSFPGRAEGREALFRAAITLLEEALAEKKKTKRQRLFSLALTEFGKLRGTPGAPLEYLGKSLVYKAWGEVEDEVKCLELALRKYPKHPLLPILIEEITFRLHASTTQDRASGYRFALLALRHLPQIFISQDGKKLLESLEQHLEPLYFVPPAAEKTEHLSLQLAFWLAKPITLLEMIEAHPSREIARGALFALLELGCDSWVKESLTVVDDRERQLFEIALEGNLSKALEAELTPALLHFLVDKALDKRKAHLLLPYLDKIADEVLQLKVLLANRKWSLAEKIFNRHSTSALSQTTHPLYTLYGCFLRHARSEAEALAHFAAADEPLYPPLALLLPTFLNSPTTRKKEWLSHAFYWEKRELGRMLTIYSPKEKAWLKLLKRSLKFET